MTKEKKHEPFFHIVF